GTYAVDIKSGLALDPLRSALGWGLGAYRYGRYRRAARAPARLAVAAEVIRDVESALAATWHARDLINTPTEGMGPAEIAAAVAALAQAHGAEFNEWVGEQLLEANFPTIHAVGRGSHRPPRLAQLRWGDAKHPHLAVVGKGVCFDTGGLNLKTADGMR